MSKNKQTNKQNKLKKKKKNQKKDEYRQTVGKKFCSVKLFLFF